MAEDWVLTDANRAPRGLSVRTIGFGDLKEALAKGLDDFNARPTHAIFVTILYPFIGILMVWFATERDLLPLAFPLIAGFALVGPFFAVGLYELSRCRERGIEVRFREAFNVFHYPAVGTLLTLGLALLVLFFLWLAVAANIYAVTMGTPAPESVAAFLTEILTTPRGWTLIVVGNGVGFVFALIALAISAVSFPLIIDRHTNLMTAVLTSVDALVKNPVPMAAWGLIVAVLLALGSLPFLIGLIVVFPVLGHATWHLYRRLIED